jgi:hypothetical protein
MVPEVVAAEERAIGLPAAAGDGEAVSTAVGGAWIFTVQVAGTLEVPRLSVTTREKVTEPEVFGTVTVMFGEVLV